MIFKETETETSWVYYKMSGTSKGLILLHLLFILIFTDDENLQVMLHEINHYK